MQRPGRRCELTDHSGHQIDELDAALIRDLATNPRSGILEMARRLGVARNTVYARLARLQERGVIVGFGPDLDLSVIGYGVTAFTTIEVIQGRFNEVVGKLVAIPEVIEVHTVAGEGDMLCRIAARSNAQIMSIVERIVHIPGVDRTRTAISLACEIRHRTMPLVERVLESSA
ncbi:MAG: Lrp/AsnC family transcriptional regulator [Acidimicrobiia bacterium]